MPETITIVLTNREETEAALRQLGVLESLPVLLQGFADRLPVILTMPMIPAITRLMQAQFSAEAEKENAVEQRPS